MIKEHNYVRLRGNMFKLIKDLTSIIGLLALIATFVSYANGTYATKESLTISNGLIQSNKAEIEIIHLKTNKIGSILCGFAIDLELPTANKACKDIIQSK